MLKEIFWIFLYFSFIIQSSFTAFLRSNLNCYKCENCYGSSEWNGQKPLLVPCQSYEHFCVKFTSETRLDSNNYKFIRLGGCVSSCHDLTSYQYGQKFQFKCCQTNECNIFL
ncbi:unnamed protein product [Brachionus calyciflorus]|uniref:Snake toxin/toxin-like domain-containing protein n=1 Tax=Brachionus calyciflorus TaxID=104777 RepID=A0A814DSB1_9BILA|nr:unnamed protein product [Brachionus calyciflorus]